MNFKEIAKMGQHLKKLQSDLKEEVLKSDIPETEKAAFKILMNKVESGEFSLNDSQEMLNDLKSGKIKSLSDACSNKN